jgi:hypothetical protein
MPGEKGIMREVIQKSDDLASPIGFFLLNSKFTNLTSL